MPDAGDTESRPADGPPPGPQPRPAEPNEPPPAAATDEGETQPIDPALLQIARQEAARTAAAGDESEPAAEEEKPKRLGPKPPELRGRSVPPTTTLPPAGYRPGLNKTPPGPPPMPPPPSPWARPGGQPTPPVPSGPPSTGAPYAGPPRPGQPPHPGPGHTGQQPAIPAHPGPGHTGQQPPIPSTGPGFGAGAPPPRKSGKVWWIVGGVAAAFVLVVGCVAGVTLIVLPSMAQQSIDQGQCVKRANDRTLVPVACQAPGALKVLQRLDDTVDGSKCPKQTTTIFTHREDDPYVLCLGTP